MTTLPAEVTNISSHGIWVMVRDEEFFLPFTDFPWFEEAPVRKILHVEMPSDRHLYWPELDIDLELDCIANPQDYPLLSRSRE